MNKKGLSSIVLLLILGSIVLGGIGIAIATNSINLADTASSPTTIWTKQDGRLECNKDQVAQTIIKYADQNYEFECGADYLVEQCEVFVSCSGTPWYAPNCRTLSPSSQLITEGTNHQPYRTLDPGEKINIKGDFNSKYLKIEYKFYPFRLYTVESGGKYLSSSSDCCLANQNELQKNQFSYSEWDCIGKGDWRNYFLDWKLVSGAKIYNGKICRDNALYNLDTEKLADGTTRNIQGEKVKDVECCPHQDNNCDSSTFTFLKAGSEEERECTFNYQCTNDGNPFDNPFSSTKAIIEKCVDGICVESSMDIECDSDAKCRSIKGEGYGCDLTFDNYGKCVVIGSIEEPECGDGYCTTGETFENCLDDCEIECAEGDKLVSVTENIPSLICPFGLFGICKERTIKDCEGEINWMKVILVIIGILVFIFVLSFIIKPLGALRKSIFKF